MKLRKLVLMSLVATMAFSSTSFANPVDTGQTVVQETDPYSGEPIEWETGQIDGEGVDEDTEANHVEPPTMSSLEASQAAEALAEMESTATAYDESTTGNTSFICDFDESWVGYNVEVTIADDNFKTQSVVCYAKNNYVGRITLPAGHYMITSIKVPGDTDGSRYPLIYDVSQFDIEKDSNVPVHISLAKEMKVETSETKEAVEDKEAPVKKDNTLTTIAVIGVLVVIGFIGYMIVKKISDKYRFE